MESGQLSFSEGKRMPRKSLELGCPNRVASGHLWLCKFELIKVK